MAGASLFDKIITDPVGEEVGVCVGGMCVGGREGPHVGQ